MLLTETFIQVKQKLSKALGDLLGTHIPVRSSYKLFGLRTFLPLPNGSKVSFPVGRQMPGSILCNHYGEFAVLPYPIVGSILNPCLEPRLVFDKVGKLLMVTYHHKGDDSYSLDNIATIGG